MTPPARILLVDDHELFREGLAGLIDGQPDLQVVGDAGDGLEAQALTEELGPDLVVMDINMPVCNGLEATRRIRKRFPEMRILILTVHEEDENLFEAVKAGACGYLLKNTRSQDFLRAVRAALGGEAALPPRLAARLLEEFARLARQTAAPGRHDPSNLLTPREQQVLTRVATGASDKQIADQLTISLHTVKSHMRNILSKLQAINRRHAARIAAEKGWIDGESN